MKEEETAVTGEMREFCCCSWPDFYPGDRLHTSPDVVIRIEVSQLSHLQVRQLAFIFLTLQCP